MGLLLVAAFLAGVLTVASPCVVMVLPILLSTSNTGGRLRPLGIVLGFAASFTAFTLLITGALQALALPVAWLRVLTVVALAIFGLALLVPQVGYLFERALAPLARLAASNMQGNRSGFSGGLLIGAGLGLLWTPCTGPIMATVIALASISGVSLQGIAISLAFTLGAGLPMLAIAYVSRSFAARAKRFGRSTGKLQKVFGALTLASCVAILFGFDVKVQQYVQSNLPSGWSGFLAVFDNQPAVQSELAMLRDDKILQAASQPTSVPSLSQSQPEVPPTIQAVNVAPTAPPPTTAAPTEAPPTAVPTLQPIIALGDMGPAPELVGLTRWFNSEPLTLKALRGKVVIVDFWTFACYNCQNTMPYVRKLYGKYRDEGLEILGIHTPEFAYERVPENVQAAAQKQGVIWPIALDPDYKTWSAFNNRYWPAFYFIDANGRLRYTHFGEGNYETNEKVVQQLLREARTAQK